MNRTVFLFVNAAKHMSIQSKRLWNKIIYIVFRKHLKRFCSQQHEKKKELKRCVYNFLVDYDASVISDIVDINKYLMKMQNRK